MKSKLIGSYMGIVIDNIDPLSQGRVQVFIPFLEFNVLNTLKKQKISYIFPGNDNDGDLTTKDIKLLKKICSWAQTQQPIFGGGSMGKLELETGKTTVSDVAIETKNYRLENNSSPESYGGKFRAYGVIKDAFAQPIDNFTRKGNFAGMDYFPENYINSPKGCFSLPEVGARVIINFLDGEKSSPVIMGKLPYAREQQIFE